MLRSSFFFSILLSIATVIATAVAAEKMLDLETDVPSYDQAGLLPSHIKRVRDSPSDPIAWTSLAYLMRDGRYGAVELPAASGANQQQQQQLYTKQQVYVRALELDSDMGPAWFNLGVSLAPDETVTVVGSSYDRLGCMVKALETSVRPGVDAATSTWRANAWYNAGTYLADSRDVTATASAKTTNTFVITVKGIPYSRLDCFVNALKIDDQLPDAWVNAGTALLQPDSFFTLKGVRYTQRDAFIAELEHNENAGASAWQNLALTLKSAKETVVVDETRYNRRKLLLKALERNPNFGAVYHNLAISMLPGDSVRVPAPVSNKGSNDKSKKKRGIGFETLTTAQVFARALELGHTQPAASWFGLGTALKLNETVTINGVEYRKRHCLLDAIKLAPDMAAAYNNLAAIVEDDDLGNTVIINKKIFTQRDLIVRAIELDDDGAMASRLWANLCKLIRDDGETVIVDGGIWTKKQCEDHVRELNQK